MSPSIRLWQTQPLGRSLMPAPYFLSALILAAIIGAATGAPGGVTVALFLILWMTPHALRLALWLRLRRLSGH
jgi:hypothetical protein